MFVLGVLNFRFEAIIDGTLRSLDEFLNSLEMRCDGVGGRPVALTGDGDEVERIIALGAGNLRGARLPVLLLTVASVVVGAGFAIVRWVRADLTVTGSIGQVDEEFLSIVALVVIAVLAVFSTVLVMRNASNRIREGARATLDRWCRVIEAWPGPPRGAQVRVMQQSLLVGEAYARAVEPPTTELRRQLSLSPDRLDSLRSQLDRLTTWLDSIDRGTSSGTGTTDRAQQRSDVLPNQSD